MLSKYVLNFILSLGFLSIFIGVFRGDHSVSQYFSLRESREVMVNTVEKLEDENTQLEQEILKLKSSKSYARKVLRDKYHILDQDESLVFFAD